MIRGGGVCDAHFMAGWRRWAGIGGSAGRLPWTGFYGCAALRLAWPDVPS